MCVCTHVWTREVQQTVPQMLAKTTAALAEPGSWGNYLSGSFSSFGLKIFRLGLTSGFQILSKLGISKARTDRFHEDERRAWAR
jgi:hypothetical protein